MSYLTSSTLPLYNNGESANSSSPSSIHDLVMPTSFQLFDISEDNKFLALIDDNFKLQVYELNDFKNEKQIKRQTMKDIPCTIDCKNPICVYISVASETGHVALSFLQINKDGMEIKKSSWFDEFTKFKIYQKNDNEVEQEQQYYDGEQKESLDKNYATCRIYRSNKDRLEMPFQGRAVFTKDRLVLIGRRTLDVYNPKTLRKMHFFKSGSFYLDNLINFNYSDCYQAQNWYRGYFLQYNYLPASNEGNGLANVSAHVRKNVVVLYDEDRTTHPKSSIKIWSISTGLLICSFTRKYDEYVVLVSEDHRFVVTNHRYHAALNIYCMKSGTRLHTYKPQGLKYHPRNSTVLFVRLILRQNYMLIGGTTVHDREESEESDEVGYLFFEIFSIEQQRTVKYIETSTTTSPNTMLALGILEDEDFLNTPSQFHGVFWETTDNDDRYLNFRTIQTNFYPRNPTSNGLIQNRLWDTFTYTYIGTEDEGGLIKDSALPGCISREKTILYLLERDTHKFVLLVSPFAVQLWQLETANDIDEAPENTTIFFNNIPQERSCYLDFSNSALIYTRSYHGINFKDSTNGDIRELIIDNEYQYCRPLVRFLGNEGHIFVYVESNSGSSISEEIILPLSELQTKTTSDPLCQSDDTADNVPEYNMYDLESCLLGLLYTYRLYDRSFNRYDPCYLAILGKTECLLKSIISPNENTGYFQTMFTSKILMRLAYSDQGLELIMDIVLQKGFPVAIHNFPAGDNESLLTVLIQRRKFDLFQILFNQAILNYYNGDTVNLYPLMDALLCLQNNQLPGLLLKCIGTLSYLPLKLESLGLFEWEYNTLGDHKSFNNFTAFHQMKKHHSVISAMLQPKKTNVNGTAITDPERYFDSNQICLIPLPTSKVHEAISYAILTKNSSYSSSQDLNETVNQEIPIVEVLLTHKWRNYIKGPFYIILFNQILFYIFYTVAISFPEEIFGYAPGSSIQHPGHLVCLVITFLTWILFFLQEVKQMIGLKREYWKSLYNYIDLLAITFPLVTLIMLKTDSPNLYDVSSYTTLILWVHFLLRLRVNRRMGILIEIIVQLGMRIAPIIGLMILLILGFTHSFIVLLRRQDDGFFQEQFEGNAASNNGSTFESSIALSDQSQQNLFKDVFLAFSTVWFFLYGIFDPILSGDVGNYPSALVLAILFSFMTALVILNVVIALMTGAIDETEKKGNRNWHIHLADVSNEVESLLPWFIKKYSAKYVYYHARRSTIELQHEKIKNETRKLKEKLLKKRDIEKREKSESL